MDGVALIGLYFQLDPVAVGLKHGGAFADVNQGVAVERVPDTKGLIVDNHVTFAFYNDYRDQAVAFVKGLRPDITLTAAQLGRPGA